MSRRLVESWAKENDCLHTAIDDLESFAWLVLWSALHSAGRKPEMEIWADDLSQDNTRALYNAKEAISIRLTDFLVTLNLDQFSPSFSFLHPLLRDWFRISFDAQNDVNNCIAGRDEVLREPFHNRLEDMCFKYYTKYLTRGVEFLLEHRAYQQIM